MGKIINRGDYGEYVGIQGGEEVVFFNSTNFYTSEGTFEYVNKINLLKIKK